MRVKKYLPSLITLTNLFLGFLSVLYIQKGDTESLIIGCYLILIAAVLDSFDGKLARKIGVGSDFGKEIDSLADLISFCLAPSCLIFNILYTNHFQDSSLLFLYFAFISSFPVLMGAIRLARFNVGHTSESKKSYFIGLPSPMAAVSICSIILMRLKLQPNISDNALDFNIILPFIILLSFLMIGKLHFSKFPLLTFKAGNQNSIRLILLIILFGIMILGQLQGYFHIILFIFSIYYILSNILFHFINNSIRLNTLKQKLTNKKRTL